MKKLTQEEKEIVEKWGSSVFTVEYLEDWLNRAIDVPTSSSDAFEAGAARGFCTAVRFQAIQNEEEIGKNNGKNK